jgi:hypothetical protein
LQQPKVEQDGVGAAGYKTPDLGDRIFRAGNGPEHMRVIESNDERLVPAVAQDLI